MTMDLRVLQDDYMKEFRKVTREKLLPGALIETNFTDEEIVIKDGRKQKPKKIIIIGYDKGNRSKLHCTRFGVGSRLYELSYNNKSLR